MLTSKKTKKTRRTTRKLKQKRLFREGSKVKALWSPNPHSKTNQRSSQKLKTRILLLSMRCANLRVDVVGAAS